MTRSRLQNIKVLDPSFKGIGRSILVGLGMIMVLLLGIQTAYAVSGITPKIATIRLKIEKQWKGNYSGFTKPARLLIYTQDQWKEVWEKINSLRLPKPELPSIDFKKKLVIAVFMGEHQGGGYDIEIIDILKKEKEIIVVVDEKEPSSDSLQTMALTSPYHVVIVKRSSFPVRFQSL